MAQTFTKQSISHETAQKMVAAAVAKAQVLGVELNGRVEVSHQQTDKFDLVHLLLFSFVLFDSQVFYSDPRRGDCRNTTFSLS